MYHYLLSYPYRLLPSGWSDQQKTVVLRFFSITFMTAGLAVLAATLQRLTKQPYVTNISLFLLTNTIMFPFIAASLSYDSLAFLSASAMLYFFVSLLQTYRLSSLLKFSLAVIFGGLVKFTLLPLAGLLVVALIWRYRKEVKIVWRKSVAEVKKRPRYLLILLVPLLLLLASFTERYAINVVRYGSYKPQCDQVMTFEECKHSGLFRRNLAFRGSSVTKPIPTPGYVVDWVIAIKKNTYSILGHKRTHETTVILYGSAVFWVASLVVIGLKVRKKDNLLLYLLAVSVLYTVILMIFDYELFAKSGRNLARQGRYLFPILGVYYFASIYYLQRLLAKRVVVNVIAVAFIMVVFFLGSLPSYIYSTTPAWNTTTLSGINKALRSGLHRITFTD
jgi:hypothetical protein